MEYRNEDHARSPWPWVAVILGILIFLGVALWVASAGNREDQVAVTDQQPQQPTTTEPPQPEMQQPATERPTATEQQPPVNIYVERSPDQPDQRPVIVVVPDDQRPPSASDGSEVSPVNVPARFTYQGMTWQADGQTTSPDPDTLTDTGATIEGNAIYVERADKRPYDSVYVETERDSGVFVKYTRQTTGRRPSR